MNLIITRSRIGYNQTLHKIKNLQYLQDLNNIKAKIHYIPLTYLRNLIIPQDITQKIQKAHHLIFTSQNATRIFLNFMANLSLDLTQNIKKYKNCLVVGGVSARLLIENGFTQVQSPNANVEELFDKIGNKHHIFGDIHEHYLYICGENITLNPREIFAKSAEYFTLCPLYAADSRRNLNSRNIAILGQDAIKNVLIYSQRNANIFENLLEKHAICRDKIRVIAISAKVANILENKGFYAVLFPQQFAPQCHEGGGATMVRDESILEREEAMLRLWYQSAVLQPY
jgi:uroporphyrinogen-III synthase